MINLARHLRTDMYDDATIVIYAAWTGHTLYKPLLEAWPWLYFPQELYAFFMLIQDSYSTNFRGRKIRVSFHFLQATLYILLVIFLHPIFQQMDTIKPAEITLPWIKRTCNGFLSEMCQTNVKSIIYFPTSEFGTRQLRTENRFISESKIWPKIRLNASSCTWYVSLYQVMGS